MPRTGGAERVTRETTIRASVDIDGTGAATIDTGLGFLDHLFELLARHALIDLELTARGDLHVDAHHTAEDCGLLLGRALDGALAERAGIRRYGAARLPMDEALADCALDVSGRFYADIAPRPSATDGRDEWLELVPHMLEALAREAGLTVHLEVTKARSVHHHCEAMVKAFARALREAIEPDPRLAALDQSRSGSTPAAVPSTKGVLR
ncbi:MAG: imidazoleglycerol-phosphate dehydratase [Chloroflexota bacterium]|nr:imidazoleglycerol-phosphate dehydratase [Chloroflexota bacterium]